MEDIIVDEPAPTSIRSRTQKRFRRSRPRRDLTVYLFDWLVKGMVVALLLSINFLLFASAGNFTVFSSGFSMSYETFFCSGGNFRRVAGADVSDFVFIVSAKRCNGGCGWFFCVYKP